MNKSRLFPSQVADFGLARSLQDSKYYITQKEAFPLGWTAPEGENREQVKY